MLPSWRKNGLSEANLLWVTKWSAQSSFHCFRKKYNMKNVYRAISLNKCWRKSKGQSISLYYLDVKYLIPNISACRARIWNLLASQRENVSQTSYSVEQTDIFQYQSYSHSNDMFIILKSNINTDIWYIMHDIHQHSLF